MKVMIIFFFGGGEIEILLVDKSITLVSLKEGDKTGRQITNWIGVDFLSAWCLNI